MRPSKTGSKSVWCRPIGCGNMLVRLAFWPKPIRSMRVCSVLLLARMPELGTLNRTQAAAIAGLAPFNRDSGTLRGKRTIFGGRRALRCGLYMAALVAARHNLILRNFYQRLRSNGKPHKVALTAVMRKLLLALNHTLKPTPCFA